MLQSAIRNGTMQVRFNEAKAEPQIKSIVEEIEEIWKNNNYPEPDSGTTTGAFGNRYMTEYNNAEDKPLVDRFNNLVDLLWNIIDEFHIGSGIWYTHYYSTSEWNHYHNYVIELISEFINDSLWESVCRNWTEEN